MNRTLSFMFAAASGATLGAFTALEIAPLVGLKEGFAATLGIIVGGLVGYIAVDFRQFCGGVVFASKVAFSLPKKIFHAFRQCSRKDWSEGASFLGMVWFMFFYMTSLIALAKVGDSDVLSPFLQLMAVWSVSISVFLPFAALIASVYHRSGVSHNNSIFLYWVSPIGIVHFVLMTALPWLATNIYRGVYWLVRQTGVFFKTLFIAVHSERRMLCCFDAMLGTLVGYFLGSWLLGTIAGLVFALISYELISKRLLKLQTN